MLVWRKLSSKKWIDSWQERLAFLGPERVVITQISNTHRIRLELFDVTPDESAILRKSLGGEVRDFNYSSADWVRHFILKKPISIRGRLHIVNLEPGCGAPEPAAAELAPIKIQRRLFGQFLATRLELALHEAKLGEHTVPIRLEATNFVTRQFANAAHRLGRQKSSGVRKQ